MLSLALHYSSWLARAGTPLLLHALPVHALRQVLHMMVDIALGRSVLGVIRTRKIRMIVNIGRVLGS